MEFAPYPAIRDMILQSLRDDYTHDDRSGIHATQLIYCLTKSYFLERFQNKPTDEELLYFARGLALEKVLVHGQGIPKGELDGIKVSPDFIGVDELQSELKTTMIYPKTIDAKGFPLGWIRQIKSYCKVAKQEVYPLAIYHLIQPELNGWILRFGQSELDEHWEWMLARRDVLVKAFEDNEPPTPFEYCDDWECKDCQFRMYCEASKVMNKEVAE